MAYEITTNQATGLTLTARLVLAGAYVGAVIALTESGTVPGHYTGTPPSGTAAASYGVLVFNGATRIADGVLDWSGVAEVRLPAIAGLVWDEVLSGSAHNAANSAGRRVRDISGGVVTVGTAQAGAAASITLAAAASAVNGIYDPSIVVITAGTGSGQARLVTQYDGPTRVASVDRDWRVVPDATSEYQILASANLMSTNEGLAQAGAAGSITLNANASAVDNTYVGQTVVLRTGTGQDQSRIAASYVGATKVLTVTTPWETQPVAGTGYVMLPLGRARVASMEPGVLTAAAIATDAISASSLAADVAAEIATGVWANGTRVLTSGANIALAKGVGLTGLNDPSVALVAGGVWDELLSGHAIVGSAGARLSATSAGGGGLDAAGVRAAVGLASANLDTQIGAVASKTTNLPAAPAAVGDIPTAASIASAVWAAVSRTLTAGTLTAADVWAYITRSLTTSAAPTAAANAAAVLAATAGAGTVAQALTKLNMAPSGVPVVVIPLANAAPELCRIYGYLTTVDGQPATNVEVFFDLVALTPVKGSAIISGRRLVASTDRLGRLCSLDLTVPYVDLIRNSSILTTPSHYLVTCPTARINAMSVTLNSDLFNISSLVE